MNKRRLVDPRMTVSLVAIFAQRATLRVPTVTYDDLNQPTNTYADSGDPLLSNIPCYVEPASGGEQRLPGNTLVTDLWNCVLAGDYPQIETTMRIRVDGDEYDIKNMSREATHTITALVLEKTTI